MMRNKNFFSVGTKVMVTTDKKLLEKHGLENRRDNPEAEFTVQSVENHVMHYVHILDDKDTLWYPYEVLIKLKNQEE